ncbi:C40 family peptidase [Heyndrickxia acidicola]|uniref:C40 family peptidase n=1 Tax=Heyndrickxia acidicola TaxID=209389 RepID=A0ABU6MJZ6_9BACI|nr:C40 family peptidase [Heyndrickxia acidicola]MED1204614.1 C40 family peptidase [Heyndrickxia acidicola]
MMILQVRKTKSFIAIAAIFALAAAFLYTPLAKASASINYGEEVGAVSKLYEGKTYQYGGTSPSGFDAGGFTQYIYKKAATKLFIPRTSADQYKIGKAVSLKNLKQGDLVFYATGPVKGKVSFAAIYLGGGKFIGATSKGVKTVNMSDKYWKDRYIGAKHILK